MPGAAGLVAVVFFVAAVVRLFGHTRVVADHLDCDALCDAFGKIYIVDVSRQRRVTDLTAAKSIE
jgi:hypothetical protein